jgi:DNA modification methylase
MYYSLRDYGTGQWVGGDVDCTHRKGFVEVHDTRSTLVGTTTTQNHSQESWGDHCRKCGAVRVDAQIGLEPLHDCLAWARQEPPCAGCWVCAMRVVFKEVYRVLAPTGTLWCNVGDSMARSGAAPPRRDHSMGHGLGTYGKQGYSAASAMPARPPGPLPEKNLLGLPWRLALALQQDGWILRSEIIWAKKNCMPESVQDRVVRAHEQIFMFSKQPRYHFDMEAIREKVGEPTRRNLEFRGVSVYKDHIADGVSNHAARPEGQSIAGESSLAGRACRSVWSIASEPTPYAHFATFPTELVRRCLLAGAPRAVCSACGKPHVRQVERSIVNRALRVGHLNHDRNDHGASCNADRTYITTGFAPSCTCNAPTQPSTILDPFCGSGTTLLVARELGHHGVGLDLSYPYLATIARERLGLAALTRWTEGAAPRPETHTDLPLFALDTRA